MVPGFGGKAALLFQRHKMAIGVLQSGASALEVAALEMSNAAAVLVQVEREIIQLTQSGVRLYTDS